MSDGRLTTRPNAPSARARTAARPTWRSSGSMSCGIDSSSAGASDMISILPDCKVRAHPQAGRPRLDAPRRWRQRQFRRSPTDGPPARPAPRPRRPAASAPRHTPAIGESAEVRRGASRCPSDRARQSSSDQPAEIEERGNASAVARLPRRIVARRRAAVPRTHVLADVAAVRSARAIAGRSDSSTGAARFDRQIRQAARRIDARTARRWRRSDTRRDSACTCRTDRRPARRARDRRS